MNKMKKMYVSPWVKAVSLDTEEDVMIRISAMDWDPDEDDPMGVKGEGDIDFSMEEGGGLTPPSDLWADEW